MSRRATSSALIVTLDHDSGPDSEWIADGLGAHVADAFAPADARPLLIAAHDQAGAMIGGLRGVSHWAWLYIRQLYVAPAARGAGLGERLMRAAEAEARARRCLGLYVDSFSPRAVGFYERLGFRQIGAIEDFPPGHRRVFLARRLDPAPCDG